MLLVALFALGCSPVSTTVVRPQKVVEAEGISALTANRPSPATLRLLRMALLDELAEAEPTRAIRGLVALYDRDWGPSGMLGPATAAAELAIIEARAVDGRRPAEAAGFYLAAAELAQDAAVRAVRGEVSPLGPRVRFAAELYNFAVGRLVALFQGPLAESAARATAEPVRWAGPLGTYELVIEGDPRPWDRQSFELRPADQIRVQGLRNRHRSRGLGAPLVVVSQSLPERALPEHGFFPSYWQFYGLTALVRFEEAGYAAAPDAPGRHRIARLRLHDPLEHERVEVDGSAVPLEAEYTAPLAILTETAASLGAGAVATLRVEQFLDEAGLFLLEPYRPDKIPLVLVHGLQATALGWMEMANDLRGDPEIRRNYQIWAFNYPTGMSFPLSARMLRESLERTIAYLDPEGDDAHLSDMVMVGHSLGGMLTRMQVTRSGSALWQAVSDQDFDSLELLPEDLELLRSTLFVEPAPWVSRAIFMATPHRGSRLAVGVLGRMVSRLLRTPAGFSESYRRLANAEVLSADVLDGTIPNVFDSVDPDDPVLLALGPLAPQVPFHTILADRDEGDEEVSDGVVEGWSALIDGAESELIVGWGHAVHQSPEGISEVRRILLEHLRCSAWHRPPHRQRLASEGMRDLPGASRPGTEAGGEAGADPSSGTRSEKPDFVGEPCPAP